MPPEENKNELPQIKISPAGDSPTCEIVIPPETQEFTKKLGESLDAFYAAFVIMRAHPDRPEYQKAASVTIRTMKTLLEGIE